MENEEDSDRKSVKESVGIGKCCRIKKSFDTDDSVPVCSVHDGKSENKEEQTSKYEVHHIFHKNVSSIFGACETGFTHCETSLHKVNKRCADNCPDDI